MLLDTTPRIDNPLLDRLDSRYSRDSMSWTSHDISESQSSSDTDFQASMRSLYNLDEIDEDEINDRDEVVKPSPYAVSEAHRLLMEIRSCFKDAFPYCSSSLESRGGINLVWDNPSLERRVWVKIPHKSNTIDYIIYREKDINKFTNKFSIEQLYGLLIWLNDNCRSIDDIFWMSFCE